MFAAAVPYGGSTAPKETARERLTAKPSRAAAALHWFTMLYKWLYKWLNNAVLVAVRTEGEETARERLVAPRVAAEPHADHRHLSTTQRRASFVRSSGVGVLTWYSQGTDGGL